MTQKPADNSNQHTAGESQLRILVVEDVRIIHDVIKRSLSDLNATYDLAEDGRTALEMIEVTLPDLVILDLALPIMDGGQVLRRLRADDRTKTVPILVISAHGESGLRNELEKLGANGYLDKPFAPQNLRSMVYELLDLT